MDTSAFMDGFITVRASGKKTEVLHKYYAQNVTAAFPPSTGWRLCLFLSQICSCDYSRTIALCIALYQVKLHHLALDQGSIKNVCILFSRRSSSNNSLESIHLYTTPQTQRKHSGGEGTDSANSLTLQSIATARSSLSSQSIQSSSLQSVSHNSADESTPTWKTSVRRIVSVLNLVPKEKTPQEKEEEQKLREQGMFLTRPAICRQPLKSVSRFCISLSGCGFLGSYHFGAVNCFMKNGQHVISRLDRVSGASAGSLVASILLLVPEKLDPALKVLFDLGEELIHLNFGALTPGYYLNERLIKIVDDFLPQDISRAQGKLYISVTRKKERTNRLISHFSSREHLLQCLMASCYIPMYSMGYGAEPPHIDGDACIDGGYTNNLPDFDDIRTITISPFSGHAEISPRDEANFFDWKMTVSNQIMNVNLQNIVRGAQALFPPSHAVLQSYYDQGYKDTLKFLIKHDIVQRPRGTEV
ncbi:hypothetical protein Y032_0105g3703 [Ancylostoma ceylanicum]|uniref:PNPLA domain-containing protein n=1 Tax=Ancylostoma ceylanicum TaxID=53326 RepID=A0A016TGA6_9BILA|nr:hypothetical protein Y032_0105g3703 [Ancylostoma ceylanicum]